MSKIKIPYFWFLIFGLWFLPMIGIVVISHGNIAREMVLTTKKIIPECTDIIPVGVEPNTPVEKVRQDIQAAIREVDLGDGILLLSDMFGGTPSNISLSFLERGKVEVVSGFNLPMLIKLASIKENKSLTELVSLIKSYGKKNIVIANEVLEGKL